MLREKTQLKARLRGEYINLDFYIERAIKYKHQKEFERFLVVNWIILDIKEKINKYKLEIEILGEKGCLG